MLTALAPSSSFAKGKAPASPQLSILGFSPTSGVVGTTVTIIGDDLNGVEVSFNNNIPAVVLSNNGFALTVQVPTGATTGRITLTRDVTTVTTATNFNVLAVPPYCTPGHSAACQQVSISRVRVASTTLDQSTSCPSLTGPSYSSFSPAATTTTTLTAGTSFTLNVSMAAANAAGARVGVWIDWNLDGTFQTTEYTSLGTNVSAGGLATANISVPSTLTPGLAAMRIRAVATTSTMSSGSSCTNYTNGESQDYFLTLQAAQPSPAITSFTPASGVPGNVITVTGLNLQNGVFRFNGIDATDITVNAGGTSATITVPDGAATGRISVTTPGGSTNSSSNFVVLGATDYVMTTAAQTRTVCEGRLLSPGFPGNYPNAPTTPPGTRVLYQTLFTPSSANSQMRLSFTQFVTEANFDGLQIFNGPTTASPALHPPAPGGGGTVAGFSGNRGAFTVTASNRTGQLLVIFSVDNAQAASGFAANVSCVANTGPIITTFTPTTGAVGTTVTLRGALMLGTGETTVSLNGTPATITSNTDTSIVFTVPTGATSGPITVTNSFGTTTTSTGFAVTGNTPTITGFTPTSGQAGTTVTITGTNLIPLQTGGPGGTGVTFAGTGPGGRSSATVVSNNGTTLVVTVPAAAQTGTIQVTTQGGNLATSSSNFTVNVVPVITNINPNTGAPGTVIQITGANLAPGGVGGTTVTFTGGATATPTAGNNAVLQLTVPAGAQTGPVTVSNSNGDVTSTINFTVPDGPSITNFTPTSGAPGAQITVNGANMDGGSFFINGVQAAVISNSGTAAVITIPTNATTGPIVLSTANGSFSTASFANPANRNLTVTLPPTVTGFTPATGLIGATVTIDGTGFTATGGASGGNSVFFNGVQATTVQRISSTQLRVIVPLGATTGTIRVTNANGTGNSTGNFIVIAPPTISNFTPISGPEGTTVQITGTGFTAGTTVTINGTPATNVLVVSATSIRADVATGTTTGVVSVSNTNGSATSIAPFTVVTNASPTIASFSPSSGFVNDLVTVTGTNFSVDMTISFNGVPTAFNLVNSTTLQTVVPVGATTGPITLTNASGSNTSATVFTVRVGPPVVFFASPLSGNAGTQVSIFGQDLAGASVRFNGILGSIISNTASDIVVAAPVGVSTGDISITTPGGTTSAGVFTLVQPPTITSFSPASAAIGDQVTLNGTNLDNITSVTINGALVFNFFPVSSTQIVIFVPNDATTGFITATNGAGSGNSPTPIVIRSGRPSITGISPTTAPAGSLMTISGFNLASVTEVEIAGQPAPFFFPVSGSQIQVQIPGGITASGRVIVRSPSGADTSSQLFTPSLIAFCGVSTQDRGLINVSGTQQSEFLEGNATYYWRFIGRPNTTYSFWTCRAGTPGGQTNDTYLRIYDKTGTTLLAQVDDNGPACAGFQASIDFAPTVTQPDTFIVLLTQFSCNVLQSSQLFDYRSRPTNSTVPFIYTVSPVAGTTGTAVAVNMANFTTGTFAINGTNQAIASQGGTRFAFQVAAGSTTGNMVATNASGSDTYLLPFTVVAPTAPLITAFTPFGGEPGTEVTLTGSNLQNATFTFTGSSNAIIISQTASQATIVVPNNAQNGPITATNPSGSSSSSQNFIVSRPTLAITGFTPTSGVVGTTVLITGRVFTGATEVTFNGVNASFTVVNDTAIRAVVPDAAVTGNISVASAASSAISTGLFTVSAPAPTITSFSPSVALLGTNVTITGTNLSGAVVFINAVQAQVVSNTATSLIITVPANATTGLLTVTTVGGSVNSATSLTVAGLPVITAFSPTRGAEGSTVIISGTNFDNATAFLGNTPVSIVSSTSTSLTIRIPAGGTTGRFRVVTPFGADTADTDFTVTGGAPVITAISPTSVTTNGLVTITGNNFLPLNTVTFNNQALTVISSSNTEIVVSFLLPNPPSPLTLPITVNTASGSVTSTINVTYSGNVLCGAPGTFGGVIRPAATSQFVVANANNATYWKFPVQANQVYEFNTCQNAHNEDNFIRIYRLSALSTVNPSPIAQADDGGINCPGNRASIEYQTTAADGDTLVIFLTRFQCSVLQFDNRMDFSVRPVTVAPVVYSITPELGPIGTNVGISGINFGSSVAGLTVTINGQALTGLTLQTNVPPNNTSLIRGVIPAGATSGRIRVATSSGADSSASVFQITTANGPTITAVNPTSAAVGSQVTLAGTNLGAGTTFTINGVAATVASQSANSAVITVPAGASTGPIAASNANGTFTSSFFLIVTQTAPAITSFSPTSGPVGASVTITGTGLANPTSVTLNGVPCTVVSSTATSITLTVPTGATTGQFTVSMGSAGSAVTATNFSVTVVAELIFGTPSGIPSPVCAGSTGSVRVAVTGSANAANVYNVIGSDATGSFANPIVIGTLTSTSTGTLSIPYTIPAGAATGTGYLYRVVSTSPAGVSPNSSAVTINAIPTLTLSDAGPITICTGSSARITLGGGTSYLVNDVAASSPLVLSAAGNYRIQAISAGCTSAISTVQVIENALPATPSISVSGGTSFCEGSSATLSGPAGATGYLWSTGETTRNITVNASGSYTLQVTNASGCTSAVSNAINITVNPAPIAPAITAGGATTFCQGGSVTLSGPTAAGYVWSTGATTQSINVSASGSYTLRIISAQGCTSAVSAATTVTVNPTPSTPTITASGSTNICQGSTVSLTASTGNSYLWSTGETTRTISVSTAGSYSVQVISAAGCTSAVSTATSVTVITTPAAPAVTTGGPTTFCQGGNVVLAGPIGAAGYVWSNGATTRTITVSASGSFTLQTITAQGCTSAVSAATSVTVNPTPAAPTVSAGSATTFCNGGSVTLTASAGNAYLWSTGETTQSITVSASGNYTARIISAQGCTSAVSNAVAVVVNAVPSTPTITAGGPTTFCQGGTVSLTAPVSAAYLWSNGATTRNIVVNASGTFTVQNISAAGCTSLASAPVAVTVNPTPAAPTVSLNGPATFCTGGSVTLTASAGNAYLWSTGETTQSITVSTSGSYTARVISVEGCTSSASSAVAVTVNPVPSTPVISAGGPTTFCQGGSVTLTAPLSGNYIWSNGATSRSINVTASGSFTVRTINVAGCTSAVSAAVNVTVNPIPARPVITAGGPTSFCTGNSVILSAPASAGYVWSTGATTQSITASSTGNYTVRVVSAEGCTSQVSAPLAVTVNTIPTAPVITASGATTICDGQTVTLTSSAGNSYLWSNGLTTQSIIVDASGNYSVQVISAAGCTSAVSSATSVTVNPLGTTPTISYTGPTTFCGTDSAVLTAQGGTSYVWSTGATTSSIVVKASGSYSVRAINGICTTSASTPIDIIVNPVPARPVVTASGPLAICEVGGSVTLTAPSANTYLWSTGATTQSITVSTAGDYTVQTGLGNGCLSLASDIQRVRLITAFTQPIAITARGNTSLCAGQGVWLVGQAGLPAYTWSNGGTSDSIFVTTAGTYTLTVGSAACNSTVSNSIDVTVSPEPAAPVVTLSGNDTLCQGETLTLSIPATSDEIVWSTGQTTQSIDVTTSGTYFVRTRQGNCLSDTSAIIQVLVRPVTPTPVVVASGATTICQGETVTLTAPSADRYLWSNGATSQSITVDNDGTFSVVTQNTGSCASTASDAITVDVRTITATPVITASGATNLCEGQTVTLSGPAGFDNYLWSNGATTQTITVGEDADYSLVVNNTGNCVSSVSNVISVVVRPITPRPTITASGAIALCTGGSVTLTASAADSYLWSTGATTQSITVSDADAYFVTTTNSNSCASVNSDTVEVVVNPIPTVATSVSGSTTICAGQTVTIRATGGDSYLWSTGATADSIVVNASGDYTVQAVTAAGCTSSVSEAVVITVRPVTATPTITVSGNTSICAGETVTLTASAADSYLWSNGAVTQSITVNTSDDYSVITTQVGSCPSAVSQVVDITVNLVPTAAISAGGATTFCDGGSVTLTATGGDTYLWSDGSTSSTLVATQSGNYSVRAISAAGCTSTVSNAIAVTVNPVPSTPVVDVNGVTTFCDGGSVTLAAPDAFAYLWSTGESTQNITVTSSGTYTLRIANNSGCTSEVSTAIVVTVNPTPVTPTVTAGGATTFCAGGSVTLTASAADAYLWSNGATTQSITVSTSDDYSVRTITAAGCTSAVSTPTTVTVNPVPTSLTVTSSGATTFCQGGSVTLTASGAENYLWSNGATTQSITVSASGNFSVVTVAAGCTSAISNTVAVTVNPVDATPVVTAGGATTFCAGGSVTLTASASTSYLWSNGATTQSINVDAAGSYSVVGINASGCTTATSNAIAVSVTPLPVFSSITAGGPTTICSGGTVTLTANTTSPVVWSTGETTNSITVTAAGTYTAVAIANGCTTAVVTAPVIIVNPTPNAPTVVAEGPTTFCSGNSVVLTATGGTSYLWSTGETTSSITVNAAGSYTARVVNGACVSAASTSVDIVVTPAPATPSITASGPTSLCAGGTVTLTANGGTSYLWSTGETTNSITVSATGSYTVQSINGACTSAASVATDVVVSPTPAAPSISASGATTVCQGSTVTLIATGGTSYLWSTGETSSSINVSTSGTYTAQVINGTCTSAVSNAITITVNPAPDQPTITASGATTICGGGTVTLNGPAGALGYLWSTGETTASITVSASGNYSLQIVAAGCTSLASAPVAVTVTVVPNAPTINVSNAQFCSGDATVLSGPIGFRYRWSTGDTTRSITLFATTTVTLQLMTPEGCLSAASAPVTVTAVDPPAQPAILTSGNNVICAGGTLTLSAPDAASYLWSNGETTRNISVRFAGSYTVTVYSAAGCQSIQSAPLVVTIQALPNAPTITRSGDTLRASGTFTEYVWTRNGLVLDLQSGNQLILNGDTGTYRVQSVLNGCSSVPSAAVVVTDIDALFGQLSTETYPNPFHAEFNLDVKGAVADKISLVMMDAVGRVVYTEQINTYAGKAKATIRANDLPMGMYTLQIIAGDRTIQRKVVKR